MYKGNTIINSSAYLQHIRSRSPFQAGAVIQWPLCIRCFDQGQPLSSELVVTPSPVFLEAQERLHMGSLKIPLPAIPTCKFSVLDDAATLGEREHLNFLLTLKHKWLNSFSQITFTNRENTRRWACEEVDWKGGRKGYRKRRLRSWRIVWAASQWRSTLKAAPAPCSKKKDGSILSIPKGWDG